MKGPKPLRNNHTARFIILARLGEAGVFAENVFQDLKIEVEVLNEGKATLLYLWAFIKSLTGTCIPTSHEFVKVSIVRGLIFLQAF